MAKPQRIFYTVDPLDRWIRVTALAEGYSEPPSSLHEFIAEASIPLRWRGGIPYVNERHYQDAIEALPAEKPTGAKKGQTDAEGKAKKGGDKKGGRRGDTGAAPVGEVAVPGPAGKRPRVREQLRLEAGGA